MSTNIAHLSEICFILDRVLRHRLKANGLMAQCHKRLPADNSTDCLSAIVFAQVRLPQSYAINSSKTLICKTAERLSNEWEDIYFVRFVDENEILLCDCKGKILKLKDQREQNGLVKAETKSARTHLNSHLMLQAICGILIWLLNLAKKYSTDSFRITEKSWSGKNRIACVLASAMLFPPPHVWHES